LSLLRRFPVRIMCKVNCTAIEQGFMIALASSSGPFGSRLGLNLKDARRPDNHMINIPVARNVMEHTVSFREQNLKLLGNGLLP